MPTLRLVRETGWSAMVRGALDESDSMKVKKIGFKYGYCCDFQKKKQMRVNVKIRRTTYVLVTTEYEIVS